MRDRAFRGTESQAEKVDGYIAAASASKESFFEAICNERKWEFGGENMRWKDLVRWNLYSKVVVESFMDYYVMALYAGGDPYNEPPFSYEKFMDYPFSIIWRRADNPKDVNIYPNTTLRIIEIYNPYSNANMPTGWTTETAQNYYSWWDDNLAQPRPKNLYSFRGYIRDGVESNYQSLIAQYPDNLPPVRYILPYPEAAVNRRNGKYKNYYGY